MKFPFFLCNTCASNVRKSPFYIMLLFSIRTTLHTASCCTFLPLPAYMKSVFHDTLHTTASVAILTLFNQINCIYFLTQLNNQIFSLVTMHSTCLIQLMVLHVSLVLWCFALIYIIYVQPSFCTEYWHIGLWFILIRKQVQNFNFICFFIYNCSIIYNNYAICTHAGGIFPHANAFI